MDFRQRLFEMQFITDASHWIFLFSLNVVFLEACVDASAALQLISISRVIKNERKKKKIKQKQQKWKYTLIN